MLEDGPGVHPGNVGRQLPHAVILKVVAPKGYEEFDSGVAKKVVLDPHGMLGAAA